MVTRLIRGKSILIAVLVAARFGAGPAQAQPPATTTPPKLSLSRLPQNILSDQKALWTSPFRVKRDDAKWWVLFGAGTGALIAADRHIASRLPNNTTQDRIGTWASRLGASYTVFPAAGGFWLAGKLTHNEKAEETGLLGFEALADSYVVVTALKAVTQRQRPFEGDGKGTFWKGDGRTWNAGSSFPSGHSITGWALVSVVIHQYPHNRPLKILGLGLASSVSVARVAARKHFSSDVFVGAAMGWFIGRYVQRRRSDGSPSNTGWRKIIDHIDIGAGYSPVILPGPAGPNAPFPGLRGY